MKWLNRAYKIIILIILLLIYNEVTTIRKSITKGIEIEIEGKGEIEFQEVIP